MARSTVPKTTVRSIECRKASLTGARPEQTSSRARGDCRAHSHLAFTGLRQTSATSHAWPIRHGRHTASPHPMLQYFVDLDT